MDKMIKHMIFVSCAGIVLNCKGNAHKHNENSNSYWEFPYVNALSALCPFDNVCNNANTTTIPGMRAGFHACCRGCSCSPHCGLIGNCCFDRLDTYHRVNRSAQQCISLQLRPERGSHMLHHFRKYYMVSVGNCTNGNCFPAKPPQQDLYRQDIQCEKCGEAIIANFGSLYPVQSPSGSVIYKNSACALCNGVKDGIFWNTTFICKLGSWFQNKITLVIDFPEYLTLSSFNTISKKCYVVFTYPGDRKYIANEECFPGAIDTCRNDSDITMMRGLDLTPAEIRDACHSGLKSPFHKDSVFANVFCFLCNGNTFTSFDGVCVDVNHITNKITNKQKGIVFWGDMLPDMQASGNGILSPSRQVHKTSVCLSSRDGQKICRKLQCPIGTTWSMNEGTCMHPFVKWNIDTYQIKLRLSILQTQPESFLWNTTLFPNECIESWLISPWPENWKIQELFAETKTLTVTQELGPDTVVESLIVVLVNNRPISSFKNVQNDVNDNMNKMWTFVPHFNNTKRGFNISARFLEYHYYYYYTSKNDPNFLLMHPVGPVLLGLYRNRSIICIRQSSSSLFVSHIKTYPVTKVFFCKLVFLYKGEYILLAEGHALKNKISGKILFDAEFAMSPKDEKLGRVRICDDEFYVTKTEYSLSSEDESTVHFLVVLVMILITSLVIVVIYVVGNLPYCKCEKCKDRPEPDARE